MRVSHSTLETYRNCPQRYKFQEIDKIKGKKAKEAVFGTAIHSALEYMFSKDPLFPTLEEILSRFRSTVQESTSFTDEQKIRYQESGERIVKSFYAKNPPWNFTIVDLESRFEVALDDPTTGEHHTLVGKIDRIDKVEDDAYEIIDYKTSSKLPSQATVDGNVQLSLYQLGLQRRWPHLDPSKVNLSLYFVKAGEKLSTKRTPEDLKNTEIALLKDIQTIEIKTKSGDFPPLVSPLCGWCPYKPICPAWRHLYQKSEEQPAGEEKTGEELVQQYSRLKLEIAERESELKKLTGEINVYLNTHGLERLFGDAHIIARKVQERSSVDFEKMRSVLEPIGLWETILAPDQKLVKKILTTLPPETKARAEEALIIKHFTMLGLSKKKIDDQIEENL
ncbi:MAG: PD-(D/E)XK nuclease family protein [Patescibacteria group bacterium]